MWKSQYCRHNAAVRNLVSKDQLLEFNAKQGWGPLCEFLGKMKGFSVIKETMSVGFPSDKILKASPVL